MLRPFTACQSAHITCTSCFTIIHHFHSSYWSVAFSRSASSLPNITVRFPCQQFLGDYSGALVWKLRKCVIADNVGGERSSVCGGMPKGRVEWVAEMYIKRSWLVLGVHGLLRLTYTHTLWFYSRVSERRADWKKSKTGSLESTLIEQSPQDWILNSSLTDWVLSHFWQFFLFSHPYPNLLTADQIRQNFYRTAVVI